MERNNCHNPCEEVKQLREEFESYCQKTEKRLDDGSIRFAVIDTKLNWLIAILGSIGAAVLGVLLKLVSGV
ncbi:MAG: hypothetical protein IJE26_02195 [Oscillospiraceae bacterium]|nr:hypothetical protein [Oscillospiraceae bacterium]